MNADTKARGSREDGARLRYSDEAKSELRDMLHQYFENLSQPLILEAGCGSGSVIGIPERAHVTGIDISQEEMDKNSDVDEKIIGDLQTYDLPKDRFDLVVCWDVLEHLPEPGMAMENMLRSVAPGGLLLLGFPNVRSVKGLVAKFTPLWFHFLINKFVYGERAGTPGLINFPTYLRWAIAPDRVQQFAERNSMAVELARLHESGVQRRFRKKVRMGNRGVAVLESIVSLCSFGTLSLQKSDCLFLFRKGNPSV